MLDKLITYIVCWYKTFYQVLPVARTNRITTSHDKFVVILVRTTGSTWYKVLYHHTMYVMGMYFTLPVHLKERNYYCTHMLCTTGIIQKPINVTYFSHFWDRPVPIFSDVRFSYLALVQDKKITCVLPANACCTVYVNCPPNSPCFSFLKLTIHCI
jgi:hypothetical protein